VKTKQIQKFVMRYLEAQQCRIVEKSPAHVTVKLSPQADKELTNRTYYWSFVERTGAAPETMTFTFIFDKEKMEPTAVEPPPPRSPQAPLPATGPGAQPAGESILGRYFGVSVPSFAGRIPQEELFFGSRRLEQIFGSVKADGRCVNMFEETDRELRKERFADSLAFSSWLCVNYKVELECDMKRDEFHSFGIHLLDGRIVEGFYDRLQPLKLTPKLPANVHVRPNVFTLTKAAGMLETFLEKKLKSYDHQWADEAKERQAEEQERIRGYYESMLQPMEDDKKTEVQEEYDNRLEELNWQYEPRIRASVINCGIFHLREDTVRSN
jgi:hypothetical protein